MALPNITNIPVPTPKGQRPKIRNVDWRSQVIRFENLNAPELRYRFSNGRQFFENPNSKTGIYTC